MNHARNIHTTGTVTSITYPAYGGSAQLDVMISPLGEEMYSGGADSLLLRFLGRRTMACLEIGSLVRVRGTLSRSQGVPVVFNPAITVMAGDENV
ncbi:MAG: OB-fold nucleic acid binding domain-containing protein [Actinomycetaceae bacterium]|nr:OB-fold nucleic acid binding domain-containing protein [Actinomycetaceae bacterium]